MTLSTRLLDSIASAAVREGLADAVYTRLDTPIGKLLVVQGPQGVARVGFEDEPEDVLLAQVAAGLGPRIVASDRELAATRDVLSAYFEGDDERLDVPVDLSLVRSDFRRAALADARTTRSARAPSSRTARSPRASGTRRRRAPSAAPARPTRSRSSSPATACSPGRGGVGSYGGGPDDQAPAARARGRDRPASPSR